MVGELWYEQSIETFTASGTWHKPANLANILITLVGAGGGGFGNHMHGGGGGGGAAVQSEWIIASDLPDSVDVQVGASPGNLGDGGDSQFLDYRAPGGGYGQYDSGGRGGLAPWRGGDGGAPGEWGGSVSLVPITLMAGGGGGAGSGNGWGGESGMSLRINGQAGEGYSPLWMPAVRQAGHGGSYGQNQNPLWPGGGGGVGQPGANGSVVVVSIIYHLED